MTAKTDAQNIKRANKAVVSLIIIIVFRCCICFVSKSFKTVKGYLLMLVASKVRAIQKRPVKKRRNIKNYLFIL